MVDSELVKKGNRVGVSFSSGSRRWEILFGTSGNASGHVSISQDGRSIIDRDLTQSVAPQKGLFGAKEP
jgi:hypothetical protein